MLWTFLHLQELSTQLKNFKNGVIGNHDLQLEKDNQTQQTPIKQADPTIFREEHESLWDPNPYETERGLNHILPRATIPYLG